MFGASRLGLAGVTHESTSDPGELQGFSKESPVTISLSGGIVALIGPNNSGKSALLRFFHEARPLFGHLNTINGPLGSALMQSGQSIQFQAIRDPEEIFTDSNAGDLRIHFDILPSNDQPSARQSPKLRLTIDLDRQSKAFTARLASDDEPYIVERVQPNGTVASLTLKGGAIKNVQMQEVLALMQELHTSMYIGPVRHIIGAGAPYYDSSIGVSVIHQWQELKAGNTIQLRNRALELEEQLARVFGFRSLEINASQSGQELLVFINKRSYFLEQFGTGISQFISILINLAIRQRPTYIMIDEPELNLHPALQLEFMRFLYSRATSGLFFATHNIGLARDIADKIYSFQKPVDRPSVVREHTPEARLSEVLGEMSFSSLREVGFQRLLLVEGPTEVRVIRQFLALYGDSRKVVVVPLGGSNMINGSRKEELQELVRSAGVASDVAAIIDSERGSRDADPDREHTAFGRVCHELGIRCHILQRRAIENYFPDAAVKRAMGDRFRALDEFERLQEVEPGWRKRENWRIAQEMRLDDIAGTDLGQFLQEIA